MGSSDCGVDVEAARYVLCMVMLVNTLQLTVPVTSVFLLWSLSYVVACLTNIHYLTVDAEMNCHFRFLQCVVRRWYYVVTCVVWKWRSFYVYWRCLLTSGVHLLCLLSTRVNTP